VADASGKTRVLNRENSFLSKMSLKKLYTAIIGILMEVGFALTIVVIAYLLCLFVGWVVR
jgi:hypothetical protein